MSKSTPICELNKSNTDTRPIVQDILKEIQLENDNDDISNNQDKSVNYQLDDNIINNDLTANMNELQDDNDEYKEKDNEQSLIENYISDNNQNIDDDDMTQNIDKISIADTNNYNEEKIQDTNIPLYERLFTQFKDPILVFLTVMLLDIPTFKNVYLTITRNIPFINNTVGILILKGIFASLMFFLLKNHL